MSNLKQANCPSCQSTLRFKPTQASLFAITCPTCGTDFQIRNTPAPVVPAKVSPSKPAGNPAAKATSSAPSSSGIVVKAELLDETSPASAASSTPSAPVVAKARPVQPTVTNESASNSNSGKDAGAVNLESLDEHLPEFAAFDATATTSQNSVLPSSASQNMASFTPGFQGNVTQRKASSSPWKWVAIAGGGLSCCGIVAAVLVLLFTDAGSSLFSPKSTPANVIGGHNKLAAEYQSVLDSVDDDDGRKWATDQLATVNKEIDELVISAARLDGVLLSDLPKEKLTDLRSAKYELTNSVKATELRRGRPLHDPLVAEMEKAEQRFAALQAAIESCLKQPPAAVGSTATVLADGIAVEEKVTRALAVSSASELPSAIAEIQARIDEFNQLAEQQSQSGPVVSSMRRDWGTRETNLELLRSYLVDRIKDELRPEQVFFMTLKDFEFVEDRFDQSLFKYELETLTSNSSSRVDAALQGESVHQKDSIASAYAASKKQELLTVGAVARLDIPESANRSRSNVASSTNRSSSSENASDRSVTRNSSANDRYAASSLSEPYPTESTSSGFGASDSTAKVSSRQPSNSRSTNSVPRGADLFKDQDDTSISSSGAANGYAGADDSLPTRLKPAALSGATSLTIRIFNAGDLDGNSVRSRIASAIRASTSYVAEDNGGLVLSFTYRGSLADVAEHIREGTIELSDSQSRTIFVQGDR